MLRTRARGSSSASELSPRTEGYAVFCCSDAECCLFVGRPDWPTNDAQFRIVPGLSPIGKGYVVTGQDALVVFFGRGQGQQQPRQVMATIDQADIRGSKPHNHDPSGAASD